MGSNSSRPSSHSSTPPPTKPTAEQVERRIERRDWSNVRGIWLDQSIRFDGDDWSPAMEVSELISLQSWLSEYLGDRQNVDKLDTTNSIDGLLPSLALESIYVAQKAAHVLSGAESHTSIGMHSWSLSSAYQSALLSARAISGLLGVVVTEIRNQSIVIDVFSEVVRRKSEPRPTIRIRASKIDRSGHSQQWTLFQRLMRNTQISESVCPKSLCRVLGDLPESEFTKQRNSLHYRVDKFPFEDLRTLRPKVAILDTGFDLQTIDSDEPNPGRCFLLAMALMRLFRAMLADLSTSSNLFKSQLIVLDKWLSQDMNRHYSRVSTECAF